jgi:hypothetical protein
MTSALQNVEQEVICETLVYGNSTRLNALKQLQDMRKDLETLKMVDESPKQSG